MLVNMRFREHVRDWRIAVSEARQQPRVPLTPTAAVEAAAASGLGCVNEDGDLEIELDCTAPLTDAQSAALERAEEALTSAASADAAAAPTSSSAAVAPATGISSGGGRDGAGLGGAASSGDATRDDEQEENDDEAEQFVQHVTREYLEERARDADDDEHDLGEALDLGAAASVTAALMLEDDELTWEAAWSRRLGLLERETVASAAAATANIAASLTPEGVDTAGGPLAAPAAVAPSHSQLFVPPQNIGDPYDQPVTRRTVVRCMRFWGRKYSAAVKGISPDHHEREDVVKARTVMHEALEATACRVVKRFDVVTYSMMRSNSTAPFTEEEQRHMGVQLKDLNGRQELVIMEHGHDESSFHSRPDGRKGWRPASGSIAAKSRGANAMVSGFMSGFAPESLKIIRTGRQGGVTYGYWTSARMLAHFRSTIQTLKARYPRALHRFYFDNSSNHRVFPIDALIADKLNVRPSAKMASPPVLRMTTWNGASQSLMTTAPNKAGVDTPTAMGLAQIVALREGSESDASGLLWTSYFKAELVRIVGAYPDFATDSQQTALQRLAVELGCEVFYLPKFHCCLNWIEAAWEFLKRKINDRLTGNVTTLILNIIAATSAVSVVQTRAWVRRVERYVQMFRNGANVEQAAILLRAITGRGPVGVQRMSKARSPSARGGVDDAVGEEGEWRGGEDREEDPDFDSAEEEERAAPPTLSAAATLATEAAAKAATQAAGTAAKHVVTAVKVMNDEQLGKLFGPLVAEQHSEQCSNPDSATRPCAEGDSAVECDFCMRIWHRRCAGLSRLPTTIRWACPECCRAAVLSTRQRLTAAADAAAAVAATAVAQETAAAAAMAIRAAATERPSAAEVVAYFNGWTGCPNDRGVTARAQIDAAIELMYAQRPIVFAAIAEAKRAGRHLASEYHPLHYLPSREAALMAAARRAAARSEVAAEGAVAVAAEGADIE
jgi:hypothetical protein